MASVTDQGTTKEERPTTSVAELSAAVEVVASFVSGFDPGLYAGEDAAHLVTVFTRAERLGGAGKTLAATRAAVCNRHVLTGHRSAAEWLATQTGESVGQAVDVLVLGSDLVDQPGVDEALRQGKLSPTRARLVSQAVKENPSSEGDLVHGAQHDNLRQLKERCLRARAQGRSPEDEARAASRIHARRHCRTWTDEEGAFRLEALLTPDAGAQVLASLQARSDRTFHQARRAVLLEPPDAYRADALVALVCGVGISDSDSDPTTDPTTDSASRPRTPGPRATVHLRVDLDALRRGSVGDGGICEIPGVGPVSVQVARELMGDALCDLVITNGVDVTTVCRLGRSLPTVLTTAITERDQHCVVPGCGVALGLERDHWQVDFAKGGVASMDNLARLCKHHHQLKTHHGFTLTGGPGQWEWIPPDTPTVTRRPKKKTPRRRPPPTGPPLTGPPLFDLEE